MKFIRKNGRVIPIREKGEKPSLSTRARVVAAAVIGVATFGLLRKFRPAVQPALRALQQQTKRGGLSALRPDLLGNKALSRASSVINGMPVNKPAAGVYLNLQGFIPGLRKPQINPGRVMKQLHDKQSFMGMLKPIAKPKTENLAAAVKKAGGIEKLKGSFIIKGRQSSMQRAASFLDEKTIKGISKLPGAAHTSGLDTGLKNAKDFIKQEKLALTGEYRAHVINGVPFGISYRYNPVKAVRNAMPGGGAFVPLVGKKRKEVAEFVAKNFPKIKGNSFAAVDIGDTKGGLKFLEANPSPGTLNNPFISRHLNRLATGRWGKDVAITAGGAAAFATYKATERKKK